MVRAEEPAEALAANAQGQQIVRKDQAGNVIETEFDGSGRTAARLATTIDAGFDNTGRMFGSSSCITRRGWMAAGGAAILTP